MDATASSIIGVVQPCLSHQNLNLTRSQRALTNPQHTVDLRPARGGGGCARNSNTPRTYDRRARVGGSRAIVTLLGPMADGGCAQ